MMATLSGTVGLDTFGARSVIPSKPKSSRGGEFRGILQSQGSQARDETSSSAVPLGPDTAGVSRDDLLLCEQLASADREAAWGPG